MSLSEVCKKEVAKFLFKGVKVFSYNLTNHYQLRSHTWAVYGRCSGDAASQFSILTYFLIQRYRHFRVKITWKCTYS